MPTSEKTDRTRVALAIALTVLALGLFAAMVVFELVLASTGTVEGGNSVLQTFTAFPLLAFALVGGLVAARRPANPVGWICLASGVFWCVVFFNGAYMQYFDVELHRRAPLSDWLGLPGWVVPAGLFSTFLLLYFPNGRLPSPRWRKIAWLSGFMIVANAFSLALVPDEEGQLVDVPDFLEPFRGVAGAMEPFILLFPLCFVLCAASLVMRYRRAGLEERERIKWVAYAGSIVAGIYTVTIAFSFNVEWGGSSTPPILSAMQTISLMAFALIPISVGFAVLRYRLYDIDRLITRTLSYAIVTAVLVGAYLSVVIVAATALPDTAGRQDWVVAVGTLFAALLFTPVRQRVQGAVDRRFNRRRYDAERTVEEFTSSLRSRVELDDVRTSLERVVATTLAPAGMGIWMAGGGTKDP